MKFPARWKELSPLFDELMELEPPARAAHLASLRRGDPGLAEELAAMLSTAARASRREFLERLPGFDGEAQPDLQGRRIGQYLVEEQLGHGGSGSVWKARRVDGRFDGVVAIKVLHASLLGRTGVARFRREGAILSHLAHPDIARLLDAGLTPEGQPYLVLELVDGLPIDQHCDRNQLDVDARIRLLRDVMNSVSHAHSQLVVHRDLKPSNILITPDGRARLLDFGIAKLLQDDEDATLLTVDGQRVLTPRYAAPEQLEGEPVTTATDVYALGVLMYRLLVGRYPTAVEGASALEVITGTLTAQPPRLANALDRSSANVDAGEIAARRNTTVKALQGQLRGDLDAIVGRALRKLPGERYESVAAFASDLDRYLARLPVLARAGTTRYRLGKLVQRHQGASFAVALLVVSIVAGLMGTLGQARHAEHQRDIALRQLKGAESTREFVEFLLSEGSDSTPFAPDLLERGEHLVDREFAGDPEEHARLQLLLGRMYGEADIQVKALDVLQRAQENARQGADLDLEEAIQCQLAWEYSDASQIDRALAMLDASIASLRASPPANTATLARCLFQRSEARNRLNDLKAALADVQEALSLIGQPRPDQRAEAIDMRARRATIQGKLGHAALAAREFRHILDDQEAIGRGQTMSARTLNNNLGVLLLNAGRPLDAARALAKAMEISRKVGHPDAIIEGNFARVLVDLGRPREAMPLTTEALGSLAGVSDGTLGATLGAYGAPAWCAVGDLAHCRSLLEQARNAFTATPPPEKAALPGVRMRAAQLLEQEGDLRGARDEMRRAAMELEALHHRTATRALALLARLDLASGDLQDAQVHAQRALALARDHMDGFDHTASLGSALLSAGLVQRGLGDEAAARRSLAAALVELRDACGEEAPETVAARNALARTAP